MVKLELKVDDGQLDLSMSELEEVPLKEIVAIKRKVKKLDLSNNQLTSLQPTFATQLCQLVELDLSKNQITEVPDNFGIMISLVHLDLYSNKIERLPLSFKDLTKLRWLDLKDNPLTPQLAKIAGPCVDQADCQKCARDVVVVMQEISKSIEQEKQRKHDERQQGAPKEKKKKRKSKQGAANTETARTDVSVTDTKVVDKTPAEKNDKLNSTANGKATSKTEVSSSMPKRLCLMLTRAFVWTILLVSLYIIGLYAISRPDSQPYVAKINAQYEIIRDKFAHLNLPDKLNFCINWLQDMASQTSAVLQHFIVHQVPLYAYKSKMYIINYVEIIKLHMSELIDNFNK